MVLIYTEYEPDFRIVASIKHLMQVNSETSILKVLAYFDLFNYPVSKKEIMPFLDKGISRDELTIDLARLTGTGQLFRHGEFYSLKNDPGLAEKRIRGNHHAQHLLSIANKISGFLSRFPYVRGIGISGSLSKNMADEHADIDFFIITKSNRLWIARTLMHAFKKLTFLTGHQHWFCMNYYIDEEALEIEEKNIFTATELATLLPVYGNGTMEKFFNSNEWTKAYFPNQVAKRTNKHAPQGGIKKIMESLFNNKMGDWLDDYFMKLTTRRWNLKEEKQRLNAHGRRMGLKTGKHYSKPKAQFFQEKIITLYHTRIREIERQWNTISICDN